MGCEKSSEQCKTVLKNWTAKYRKVKDNNWTSGRGCDTSFPYFDEMDSVLCTRATSEPPLLLDSGVPVLLDDGIACSYIAK